MILIAGTSKRHIFRCSGPVCISISLAYHNKASNSFVLRIQAIILNRLVLNLRSFSTSNYNGKDLNPEALRTITDIEFRASERGQRDRNDDGLAEEEGKSEFYETETRERRKERR